MENEPRQSGLDGLRGLAALLVFGVHMWIYQLPNTVELRRDSLAELVLFEARVAFAMFFVLSGYLLYRPFARAALGAGRARLGARLSAAPRGSNPAARTTSPWGNARAGRRRG